MVHLSSSCLHNDTSRSAIKSEKIHENLTSSFFKKKLSFKVWELSGVRKFFSKTVEYGIMVLVYGQRMFKKKIESTVHVDTYILSPANNGMVYYI